MVAVRPRTRKTRRHRRAATAARARLDIVRSEIRELARLGQPVIARERTAITAALMDNRRSLSHATSQGSVPALAAMELDRWVMWRPNNAEPLNELRIGALREGTDGESLGVPCVVPIREGRAVVIVSRTDRQREEARGLWQSLAARLAALTAGRTETILLDPAGKTFPAGHRLFARVVGGTDVGAELDRLSMQQASAARPVILAGDVPHGYGPREAALLLAMIRSGARHGTTIVMHLDEAAYHRSIGEPNIGGIADRWLVDIGAPELNDPELGSAIVWDGPPDQALLDLIGDRLIR